jgi:competence protein ComEA
MIDSHLIQPHQRNSLAARDVLSKKSLVVVALLVLALAGVLAAVAGSPPVFAEDQRQVATPEAAPATDRVNINAADAETLASSLRGVGEARALEIVRHRETYGPFASADELMDVKGIGQATLDRNRDLITLE